MADRPLETYRVTGCVTDQYLLNLLTLTSPFYSLRSPLSPIPTTLTLRQTHLGGQGPRPLKFPTHISLPGCLAFSPNRDPVHAEKLALDRRLQRSQLAEPHPIRWSRPLLLSSRASVSSAPKASPIFVLFLLAWPSASVPPSSRCAPDNTILR